MAEIWVRKEQGGHLSAISQEDVDKLQKWTVGDVVKATIVKPRNVQFHRKFFAFIGVVFENQEKYINSEAMRDAITMQAGHYEQIETLKGGISYKPKSISFASMDDVEFSEFYEKCIDIAIMYLMEGADAYEIKANVEKVLGFTS